MISFLKNKFHSLIPDKKFSEILSGSAWALGANSAAAFGALIISIIVARFYGAEAMGVLAVVQSYLTLATIFTVLGTSTSILRLIPEHMSKHSVTSAFRVYRKTQYLVAAVALCTGTLFFFLSGAAADVLFHKPQLTYYLTLGAGFVIFKSLMDLNTQAVLGLRLIRTFAFMQILPPVSMLALLVVGIFLARSQGYPVYAQFTAWTITAGIGVWIMNKAFKARMQPSDRVRPMSIMDILTLSLPMLMTTSMSYFVVQVGVIILAAFRSEAEVGYYDIAVKLSTLTAFMNAAISSMVGPKFAELYYTGKMEELLCVAQKSAKYVFWSTIPILVGLLLVGRPLLSYLFGQEFTKAYPALVILVLGQFFNSVSGSSGLFMNMTGKQKTFRNIIFMAAIVNILLSLFLVPRYGIIGSATAAMTSQILWNIVGLLYLKIRYGQTIGYLPLYSPKL